MTQPATFAFSYSRYSTWKDCPKQAKLKYIDKVDTGPTPEALLVGRKVHDDIAKYLEDKASEVPERLQKNFAILGEQLQWMNRKMQKGIVQVEKQMAFDNEIKPCSWFSKSAQSRFIWDVLVVDSAKIPGVTIASAVDWKTGKPYGSYDDQMEIFSLPAFWTYPNLEKFTGHLLYLDTGEDKDFEITREEFNNGIERKWLGVIAQMNAETGWKATPSKAACRFCDFGKKNLDICEDWIG